MSEIRKRLEDFLPKLRMINLDNYNIGWNDAIACCLDKLEKHCKVFYGDKSKEHDSNYFFCAGPVPSDDYNHSMLVLDIQPIKVETCKDILKEIYESGQTSWKDSDRIKAALEREEK